MGEIIAQGTHKGIDIKVKLYSGVYPGNEGKYYAITTYINEMEGGYRTALFDTAQEAGMRAIETIDCALE